MSAVGELIHPGSLPCRATRSNPVSVTLPAHGVVFKLFCSWVFCLYCPSPNWPESRARTNFWSISPFEGAHRNHDSILTRELSACSNHDALVSLGRHATLNAITERSSLVAKPQTHA